jgi:hypothetical protein
MDEDMDDYQAMFESAFIDGESLTVLLVAGGSRSEVLTLLGADPGPVDLDTVLGTVDFSAYAAAEVSGGVVAFEHTGYADPSPTVLAALSALGGAAAVTRSNIQGHDRFGCARRGELEFDSDEFKFVEAEEKQAVPEELRPLFDSAWIDLDADDDEDGEEGWVGLEMAALHTGVRLTTEDLRRAVAAGYHRVRSLTYLE